ncbi:hypothetical protein LOK49_LG12G02574, partial [Camellia lanceoleosa]
REEKERPAATPYAWPAPPQTKKSLFLKMCMIVLCVGVGGEQLCSSYLFIFVDCPPTFTMYEFDAAVNGALVIKCICLTSSNNPDRSIISDEVLLKILDLPILVVLDEAYIEFSGIESKMQWVKKHEKSNCPSHI